MKFRRKPTIIEAEQFLGGGCPNPKGICMLPHLDGDWVRAHVHTIHNNQAVVLELGDWVIPEPDGIHYYPCKPDIFAATYEKVEE